MLAITTIASKRTPPFPSMITAKTTGKPDPAVILMPPDNALGRQIIRSVAFGALRYALIAPIPFLMTPFVLHRLGVTGYGTWAVFLALNGLTSLADLGLVGTVSRFVADYHARHDTIGLTRLIDSGLAMFLFLDLIIGIVLALLSPFLSHKIFHGSSVPSTELIFLLRCFILVIAANVLSQLFASLTTGLQRLDITNIISASNVLLSAIFGASLLLLGWGLRGLVYGYVASGCITVTVYVIVVRSLLPGIVMNPFAFDFVEARKMLGYSLRLYVTQAAVAIHNQVEKVFLAALVGVAPVGWYDIASDTALKVRGAIGFVLGPVLPAASQLNALGDEIRMKQLYYRTHKYLAIFGVPAVCFIAAASREFLLLWLGPGMVILAVPLSILLIVNFFNLATGPGFCILAGKGDLKPGIQSATLGVVINLFLSFGLIYKFGFTGAVLGTSLSLIIAAIYFMSLFHGRTGYSIFRLLQESYLKPSLCAVAALLFLVWLRNHLANSWFGLIEQGLIFGFLYAVAILSSRFLDAYDWEKIQTIIPIARHLQAIPLVYPKR